MDNASSVAADSVVANEICLSTVKNDAVRLSRVEVTLREPENGDEMIRRIIGNYDIGAKLRHLRMRKRIALVDLGKHTGLSASMLSQLENGKLVPTLPTLARIAMVFDVGLDHFFGNKRRGLFTVVRKSERIRFPERPDMPKPAYFF